MRFRTMRAFFIIIVLLTSVAASAQTNIRIKDFSEKYYARVTTKKDSASYYIQVFEKGSNKKLIECAADQISDDLIDNGQLVPNVKELPYGDQSVLIYEDFNFDGVKDFALMNGYQSCYSGPSFNIYLAVKNSFVYSDGFSDLSNNYCGMFQVDAKKKRINTMTKSGCCWHQFSEYIVKNNAPFAVKIVEEARTPNIPYLIEVNTQEWINGSMREKQQTFMPYDDVDTVLSFRLKKNQKTVCIFSVDETFCYSLIRKDGSIEFYYPQPSNEDSIHYNVEKASFSFKNKDVSYEVYKGGVRIQTPDSLFILEGDPASIKGSLLK